MANAYCLWRCSKSSMQSNHSFANSHPFGLVLNHPPVLQHISFYPPPFRQVLSTPRCLFSGCGQCKFILSCMKQRVSLSRLSRQSQLLSMHLYFFLISLFPVSLPYSRLLVLNDIISNRCINHCHINRISPLRASAKNIYSSDAWYSFDTLIGSYDDKIADDLVSACN